MHVLAQRDADDAAARAVSRAHIAAEQPDGGYSLEVGMEVLRPGRAPGMQGTDGLMGGAVASPAAPRLEGRVGTTPQLSHETPTTFPRNAFAYTWDLSDPSGAGRFDPQVHPPRGPSLWLAARTFQTFPGAQT